MTNEQVIVFIEEFKEGNFKNFNLFYDSLKRNVFYNILGMVSNYEDAEEILQETFVTFLEHISKVNGHNSPLGYLFRISYNLSKDYLRKKHREIVLDQVSEEKLFKEEHEYDGAPEMLERIRKLLNQKEYQVFIMKALDEYSHQQIAEMLNRPIGTITWLYQQAIKKIKRGLGEYNEW